jgi:hypothetical protein
MAEMLSRGTGGICLSNEVFYGGDKNWNGEFLHFYVTKYLDLDLDSAKGLDPDPDTAKGLDPDPAKGLDPDSAKGLGPDSDPQH